LTPLLGIDEELADLLEHDDDFRRRFIRKFAQAEVAAEIRLLRKKRKLKQGQVAELAHTGQSAISRIEKADYDGWTYKTLIGIAEALRARLRIRFEPIEDVASGYRGLASVDQVVATSVGRTKHELIDEIEVDGYFGPEFSDRTALIDPDNAQDQQRLDWVPEAAIAGGLQ